MLDTLDNSKIAGKMCSDLWADLVVYRGGVEKHVRSALYYCWIRDGFRPVTGRGFVGLPKACTYVLHMRRVQ